MWLESISYLNLTGKNKILFLICHESICKNDNISNIQEDDYHNYKSKYHIELKLYEETISNTKLLFPKLISKIETFLDGVSLILNFLIQKKLWFEIKKRLLKKIF